MIIEDEIGLVSGPRLFAQEAHADNQDNRDGVGARMVALLHVRYSPQATSREALLTCAEEQTLPDGLENTTVGSDRVVTPQFR